MRALALLLVLVSCKEPRRAVPPPTSSPSVASSPASPPAPAAPVGFVDGELPSSAALRENDAAVAALAKKDVAAATAGFERALAASPAFVLARYNFACALARSGAHEAAARELAAVFEVDWVGLRAQAARDEDLAAFRASEPGRRLLALEPTLETRYRIPIERGVRALLWNAREAGGTVPEGLRVGVWDPETKRFVAVSERRRGAFGALVSSELPFAILATGSVPSQLGGDLANHFTLKDVTYWSWGTSGVPIATTKVEEGALAGSIQQSAEDVSIVLHRAVPFSPDPNSDLYELHATFSPALGTKVTPSRRSPAPKLDPKRPRGVLELPFHNGFLTSTFAAGHTLEGRKLGLPSGKTIEIPKELAVPETTPSIEASPDGAHVALVWDTHRCTGCGGNVTVGSHRVVLVDVASGSAKKIAEGTGVAAVRFSRAGLMFVQRDRRAYAVVDPDDPKTWRALPLGVLFTAPVVPEAEVQCCGF
jgi:hypothetical protein